MFSFLSVSVFMFTVYCLMDPCGLILNKDDDDDEMIKQASSKHQATMKQNKSTGQ